MVDAVEAAGDRRARSPAADPRPDAPNGRGGHRHRGRGGRADRARRRVLAPARRPLGDGAGLVRPRGGGQVRRLRGLHPRLPQRRGHERRAAPPDVDRDANRRHRVRRGRRGLGAGRAGGRLVGAPSGGLHRARRPAQGARIQHAAVGRAWRLRRPERRGRARRARARGAAGDGRRVARGGLALRGGRAVGELSPSDRAPVAGAAPASPRADHAGGARPLGMAWPSRGARGCDRRPRLRAARAPKPGTAPDRSARLLPLLGGRHADPVRVPARVRGRPRNRGAGADVRDRVRSHRAAAAGRRGGGRGRPVHAHADRAGHPANRAAACPRAPCDRRAGNRAGLMRRPPSPLLYELVGLGMAAYAWLVHRAVLLGRERLRLEPGVVLVCTHLSDADVPVLAGALYRGAELWRDPAVTRPSFAVRNDLLIPGYLAGYPRGMPLALRRVLWRLGIGPVMRQWVRCLPVRFADRMRLVEALRRLPDVDLAASLPPERVDALGRRAAQVRRPAPRLARDVLAADYADLLWQDVGPDEADGPEFEELWKERLAASALDLRALIRHVRAGGALVLFPHGEVSTDGAIGPLDERTARFLRSARATAVQPVAIANDPLTRRRPRTFVGVGEAVET